MYTTKAEDLTRIANDLDQLARKYSDGAQQLDQQTAGLDGATQQLISGGPEHWLGISSEAFQGAWDERRARLQQISQILSQSAQHFTRFAQTIEDNLPTIRADQAVLQESASHILGIDDQASILDEESQAQNGIITALAMLNFQLEALAEEVKDCPEVDDRNAFPGEPSDNVNASKKEDKGGRKDTANQKEKVEFEYAWERIQRILGKKLSKADRRRLHDEITKQGLGPEEIIEIGISMFGDYGNDS